MGSTTQNINCTYKELDTFQSSFGRAFANYMALLFGGGIIVWAFSAVSGKSIIEIAEIGIECFARGMANSNRGRIS